MTLGVLLGLAVLTYASRAASLAFLPSPPEPIARVLRRIPGPLFAAFASLSLMTWDRTFAAIPVLAAAAGALAVAWFRSLPISLVGGLAGYVAAVTFT